MVFVSQTEKVEPIDSKKRLFRKFAEIETQHENAVVKTILVRFDAAMHDIAFIEAGAHDQGLLPNNCSQSLKVDQRPSSWNPNRCQAPQKYLPVLAALSFGTSFWAARLSRSKSG